MMQMQAGAINLTPLLSWAPLTQKDLSPSLSLHCSIVLHSPPGHMKNESGPGDAGRRRRRRRRGGGREEEQRGKERETPKSTASTFLNNF